MSRFEKTIRALMKSIVQQCEMENHFRANNMPEQIHYCTSKISTLGNILNQAEFFVTFDTDDKLNYTKVYFKDMIKRITITYDILSTKERLNAIYGKSALSGIYETEDGYEL